MDKSEERIERKKLIYIVGTSHSGSTMLSYIIGSAPQVINGGELKFFAEHSQKGTYNEHLEYMKNTCSCGMKSYECPFWNKIESKLGSKINIYHESRFRGENMILRMKILLPFYKFPKSKEIVDDYLLVKTLIDEGKKTKASISLVLDTSKNINRLIYLRSHLCFDIKVLFLVRDGRGFVNSSIKATKKGFYRWLKQWIITNFLIARYLKKENITYFQLSYDEFCINPDKYISKINQLFDINIPADYVSAVKRNEDHIRAGNPVRLDIKNFSGMKIDRKWQVEMSLFKRIITTIITYPFNKLWIYKNKTI